MKIVKCIVDSIKCYGDYDLGSCYLLVDEDDEGNIKVIDKNGKPYWEYNRHFVYQKAISECAVELGEEVLPTHVAERQGKSSKTIKIKYFPGATKLKKISKGDWIDLYANKDMFIPEGSRAMIPLGVAMELPEGYEAIVAPRSSTFKTWGIVQTNSIGVIDNSYSGDNDQWHMPVYCLMGKDEIREVTGRIVKGTHIHKGDKICQFRIQENQPEIRFEEVSRLDGKDRGAFGSTGNK